MERTRTHRNTLDTQRGTKTGNRDRRQGQRQETQARDTGTGETKTGDRHDNFLIFENKSERENIVRRRLLACDDASDDTLSKSRLCRTIFFYNAGK